MQVRSVFLFTARWFTKKPFRSKFVGQPRLNALFAFHRFTLDLRCHPYSPPPFSNSHRWFQSRSYLSLPTCNPEPNHQLQLIAASGQGNRWIESAENVGGYAKLWKVHHLVHCVPTFSLLGRKSKEFAQEVLGAKRCWLGSLIDPPVPAGLIVLSPSTLPGPITVKILDRGYPISLAVRPWLV